MIFHVGQKVVMVGWLQKFVSKWQAAGGVYPNVGDVYTVRAVKPWEDSAVLLLAEIDNSHLGFDPEPGFRQDFFRPAVERKTDIGFAKAILKKASRTVPALSPADRGSAA